MANSLEVLLEKSQHDLTAVNLLLKEPSAPEDIIAFHIQQMVEKLLKARRRQEPSGTWRTAPQLLFGRFRELVPHAYLYPHF